MYVHSFKLNCDCHPYTWRKQIVLLNWKLRQGPLKIGFGNDKSFNSTQVTRTTATSGHHYSLLRSTFDLPAVTAIVLES